MSSSSPPSFSSYSTTRDKKRNSSSRATSEPFFEVAPVTHHLESATRSTVPSLSSAVITLIEDDDDDDDIDYAEVVMPAIKNGQKTASLLPAPTTDIIDLCDSVHESEDTCTAKRAALTRPKKRPKPTAPHQPTTTFSGAAGPTLAAASLSSSFSSARQDDDKVVDIESAARAAPTQDPALLYRQTLGPLRCEFVPLPLSGHAFEVTTPSGSSSSSQGAVKGGGVRKLGQMGDLYKEFLEYKLNLPVDMASSIFVRVHEARLDLLRALITGPEGTPYAHGAFMFDVSTGQSYPSVPPQVKFLTTGKGQVRFNPNLYKCGKVCLSLLGTWSGPGWIPNKSTLLQVLVSIQGLILVPEPYYNEPGYAESKNKTASDHYTKQIRRYTLQHAILDFVTKTLAQKDDYPEFAEVILRHFCAKAHSIQEQVKEWITADPSLRSLAAKVEKVLKQLLKQFQAFPTAKTAPMVGAGSSASDPMDLC